MEPARLGAVTRLRAALLQLRHRTSGPAWYPFLITFTLVILLRVLRFLLVSPPPAAGQSSAAFVDAQVAIKVWESGRYLEVGADKWIFASSYSHNKHATRFEVEAVPPEMLRSLMHAREFSEQEGAVGKRVWDLRPEAAGSFDYSRMDYTDNASPSPPPPPEFADDEAAKAAELAASEAEAESVAMERARRRLVAASRRGAHGWVLLRSAYAGGYVEVVGRGEEREFVVRIAPEGRLSYRSLFLIRGDAVWSHAVGGFLNWRRPTESSPQQHVRAHGNVEPWGPLRELPASARMHITKPPPVVDLLGGMACPGNAPAFDWNLLLDAARAGTCRSDDAATLSRAASAFAALEDALGRGKGYGYELADLANAYRMTLLDPEWIGVLDLQLAPCSDLAPADRPAPFSRLSADGTELIVDAEQCPNAAYSEVLLRPTPNEPLALEMTRLSPPEDTSASAELLPTDADAQGAIAPDSSLLPPSSAPPLRAKLLSDAAFVLCDYTDSGSASAAYDAASTSVEEEGDDASYTSDTNGGGDGETEQRAVRQALHLRLAPEVAYFNHGKKRRRRRVAARTAPFNASAYAEQLEELVAADGATLDVAAATAAAEAEEAEALADATATASAEAAAEARAKSAQYSVLMLQLDATSRAHLQRMLPRSLALLRAMGDGGATSVYEFPYYSIVGFNSLPNMVPMLAGVESQALIDLTPLSAYGGGPDSSRPAGVWSAFAKHGYATALLEEIHDGCNDPTLPHTHTLPTRTGPRQEIHDCNDLILTQHPH